MSQFNEYFPASRLRRMRQSDFSRRLMAEHQLTVNDLIYPMFIIEGENSRETIASMFDAVSFLFSEGRNAPVFRLMRGWYTRLNWSFRRIACASEVSRRKARCCAASSSGWYSHQATPRALASSAAVMTVRSGRPAEVRIPAVSPAHA